MKRKTATAISMTVLFAGVMIAGYAIMVFWFPEEFAIFAPT